MSVMILGIMIGDHVSHDMAGDWGTEYTDLRGKCPFVHLFLHRMLLRPGVKLYAMTHARMFIIIKVPFDHRSHNFFSIN